MPTDLSAEPTAPHGWRFDNTYARLPAALFAPATPARFARPQLTILNERLAADLGLSFDGVPPDEIAALLSGQSLPAGAEPIAQAYAGHQFGGFTMLGDGRAILLGEQRTPAGRLVDIQLKGSGPTRYSRRGDGLAALGPMLREYVISEAMHALGIPTTRSLAVVTTGEPVYRETVQRGAVLTRVAASHLRVGTFQYAAARGEVDLLCTLADYAIARHDPELAASDTPYLALLDAVIARQADLIARWQLVGFVHGVMNTDNMAISGETIDYGPCAFLDTYHPDTVFSSIDHGGRYAFGQQPNIAVWNLARFAETLLPLIDDNTEVAVECATASLERFPDRFADAWLAGFRRKLGLTSAEPDDQQLAEDFLEAMTVAEADFTRTFLRLADHVAAEPKAISTIGSRDEERPLVDWLPRWHDRLRREGRSTTAILETMAAANPVVIPRNHRVEEALAAATLHDDLTPFRSLVAAVTNPFARPPESDDFASPPPPGCGRYRTFCGT